MSLILAITKLFFSVDCEWSNWGNYSICTVTCGNGTQIKTRTKNIEEEHGGSCPGLSQKDRQCSNVPCPGTYYTNINIFCSGPIHYLI